MAQPLMAVNMETLLEFEVPEERCPLVLKVFQSLAQINKREDVIRPGENRPVLTLGNNKLDVVNLIVMVNEIFEKESEDVPITEVYTPPPKQPATSSFLAKPYTKEELVAIDLDAVPLETAWDIVERLVATTRADSMRNEDSDIYNRTTLAMVCAINITMLNIWEKGQKLKQTLAHVQRLYKSVENVPLICTTYNWEQMGLVADKLLPTLKRWKDTAEENHRLALAAHSNKSSTTSSSKRRKSEDVESVEMEGVVASPEPATTTPRPKAAKATSASATATKKKQQQQQQQTSPSTTAPALSGLAAAAMASMSKAT